MKILWTCTKCDNNNMVELKATIDVRNEPMVKEHDLCVTDFCSICNKEHLLSADVDVFVDGVSQMKSKAKRIKQIQDNLLESHAKMRSGEMSAIKYSEISRDAKLAMTKIRQDKQMDQIIPKAGDSVSIRSDYKLGINSSMGYKLKTIKITVGDVTELGFTIKESPNWWLGTFEHPFNVITKIN